MLHVPPSSYDNNNNNSYNNNNINNNNSYNNNNSNNSINNDSSSSYHPTGPPDEDNVSSMSRDHHRKSSSRSHTLNTSFPVSLPLSQGALPVSLRNREKDIYNCSDSEDEVVDIIRTKKAKITGECLASKTFY
jgi:hypothetical protein